MRLYTVDVSLTGIELEPEEVSKTSQEKKKERVRERLARDKYRASIYAGEMSVSDILDEDPELLYIRKPFSQVSLFHRNLVLGVLRHIQRGFQELYAGRLEESKENIRVRAEDERIRRQGQRDPPQIHGGTQLRGACALAGCQRGRHMNNIVPFKMQSFK